MSNWSHEAAAKFKRKQIQDHRTNHIIEEQGPTQFDALGELFDAEAANFNIDSHTQLLKCNRDLGDEFDVKRSGHKAYLKGTFKRGANSITIAGVGGLTYKGEFSIKADVNAGTAYFANSNGDAIQMEDIVHAALSALLEI